VNTAVGLLNLLLGSVYTSYGVMTIVDLKRGWRTSGFSHFGAAWLAMAFTCGPHHLVHGMHVLAMDHGAAHGGGGGLDLVAILIGLPAGVLWFLLRVEALVGGRGDRFVSGTPVWLYALPMIHAILLAAVINAASVIGRASDALPLRVVPNIMLGVLYTAIGIVLLRTQFRNRPHTGGWSVSGVSLALVMFTCAVMHWVYAVYVTTGHYTVGTDALVIHFVGVPAAAYFLWVVWALHRGTLADWNQDPARRAAIADPIEEDPVAAELVGAR
jgi:hypothetical protein